MSYSRWSNSTWYTYWISMGPADDEAPKEEQRMAIHYSIDDFMMYQYSYDVDEFMGLVEETVEGVTEKELDELRGYILEFREDVESEY